MSKNRKHRPASVRFGPALKALALCAMIGGSGVGYVGQKNQLYVLGRQFKAREVRLQKLRNENSARSQFLDALQSPLELEERSKQMNLGFVAPQPDQIIHLIERPVKKVEENAARLYAAKTSPSGP